MKPITAWEFSSTGDLDVIPISSSKDCYIRTGSSRFKLVFGQRVCLRNELAAEVKVEVGEGEKLCLIFVR